MLQYLISLGKFVAEYDGINIEIENGKINVKNIRKFMGRFLPFIVKDVKRGDCYLLSNLFQNITQGDTDLKKKRRMRDGYDKVKVAEEISEIIIKKANKGILGSTLFPFSLKINESPNYFPEIGKIDIKIEKDKLLYLFLGYTTFLFNSVNDTVSAVSFYSPDADIQEILLEIFKPDEKLRDENEYYWKNINITDRGITMPYEFLNYTIYTKLRSLRPDYREEFEKSLKGKIFGLIMNFKRSGQKVSSKYDIVENLDVILKLYLKDKLWDINKNQEEYNKFYLFVSSLYPQNIDFNEWEYYSMYRNRFLWFLYHYKEIDYQTLLKILDFRVNKDGIGRFSIFYVEDVILSVGEVKGMKEDRFISIYKYGYKIGAILKSKNKEDLVKDEYYKLRNKPTPNTFLEELADFLFRVNRTINTEFTVPQDFIDNINNVNVFNKLKCLFLVGLINGVYVREESGGDSNE